MHHCNLLFCLPSLVVSWCKDDSLPANREITGESTDDWGNQADIHIFNCRCSKQFWEEGEDPGDIGSQIFPLSFSAIHVHSEASLSEMIDALLHNTVPLETTKCLGIPSIDITISFQIYFMLCQVTTIVDQAALCWTLCTHRRKRCPLSPKAKWTLGISARPLLW